MVYQNTNKNAGGLQDGLASIWRCNPTIQLSLRPCVSRGKPWRRVATLFAYLFPCSLQQNEIVRIRLLDRRDRFSGDSFSESGAKGKVCHASTPYASRAASVPVTGPFARGRSGGHGRVKICDPTYGVRPLHGSAWAVRIKQRAESILGIDILLAAARLCTEELFITEPSLSLTLPVSHFEGKGHFEQDLSSLIQPFFHPLHINQFFFFPDHNSFPLLPEGNFYIQDILTFLQHTYKPFAPRPQLQDKAGIDDD